MNNEIWIDLTRNKRVLPPCTVIAISSCGRIKRHNGVIEDSYHKQKIQFRGRQYQIHRLIALYFIKRVPGKHFVDHITHHPVGMNINNVCNLRWCTQIENLNFVECKNNMSLAKVKQRNSVFGMKYYAHFGYSNYVNPQQYEREKKWFYNHGKCRWE